jgi:hypothetical protein
MSHYYPSQIFYRYASKLRSDRDFKTAEEAAEFDQREAINRLRKENWDDFPEEPMVDARGMILALRYLADEIESRMTGAWLDGEA